jgi:tetratricopeptide (TPR) repeat protein
LGQLQCAPAAVSCWICHPPLLGNMLEGPVSAGDVVIETSARYGVIVQDMIDSQYSEASHIAAASVLLERALTIRKRSLGPDHPQTASTLEALGWTLANQGKLDDAQDFFQRALSIREKAGNPAGIAEALRASALFCASDRDSRRPMSCSNAHSRHSRRHRHEPARLSSPSTRRCVSSPRHPPADA